MYHKYNDDKGKVQSSGGTIPVNKLLSIASVVNDVRAPNTVGIVPSREFGPRFKYCNSDKAAKVSGSVPCRRFVLRSSLVKAVMSPIAVGITPVNLLLNTDNSCNLFNADRDVGIVPMK